MGWAIFKEKSNWITGFTVHRMRKQRPERSSSGTKCCFSCTALTVCWTKEKVTPDFGSGDVKGARSKARRLLEQPALESSCQTTASRKCSEKIVQHQSCGTAKMIIADLVIKNLTIIEIQL
jgi:hypothetical protein